MKLQADTPQPTSIIAYGEGWLQLPEHRYEQSVLLTSDGEHHVWACSSFEALTQQQMADLAVVARSAQVVLLGSGKRTRFPPAAWLRPFMAMQVGLESMDTAAACRTFNVLAGEGRKVVAALIVER
ncbi:hypothetical protein AAV94_05830 [Lampropedia cohaerens]|uniref:Xcc1710-like domain-containing protein n=1 Tax=Lampropedia cohaerens TaxID=1610491 RepID=A0A0U1Q153_9BURK|nr:Mth938-like domain-containing protein [Lampropedia cohaerens]KKW68325.1 hypothetical protein AAV94_05830 [Lampropedia cohaerens]